MPTGNQDYKNSIIYKICCRDPTITDIYIGSTTNFRGRKSQHKSVCGSVDHRHRDRYLYKFIRDNGDWNHFDMIMIEQYECKNKLELLKRERYYIEQFKATLNSKLPTRTIKEYYVSNPKKAKEIKMYRSNWKKTNQKYKDEQKKYTAARNTTRLMCECYGSFTKQHEARHKKTIFHLNYLNNPFANMKL